MLFANKWNFVLFILFLTTFLALGQENPYSQSLQPPADFDGEICLAPTIKVNSTVRFTNFSKVYLEFNSETPLSELSIVSANNEFSQQFTTSNGSVLLENIPNDSRFYVQALNTCDEQVIIDVITTKQTDIDVFGIKVSAEFFDLIGQYKMLEDSKSLYDYIESLDEVNYYEKLGFYQDFYNGGEALTTDDPVIVVGPPNGGNDGCTCNLVVRSSPELFPGNLNPYSLEVEPRISYSQDDDGNFSKIPMSKGQYWWFRNNKGPSKWHAMWTEGWKTGSGNQNRMYNVIADEAEQNGSPHAASLAFNYVCDGVGSGGSRCPCKKNLQLEARYETKIEAHAELLNGGIFDKSSEARVQDIAVAAIRNGNEPPEIVGAGEIRTDVMCSSGTNEDWFIELIDVAAEVGTMILTGDIDEEAIDELADELQEFIQEPIYIEGNCETITEEEVLLEFKGYMYELERNTIFEFSVFSFTSQRVGGKRRWFSRSQVESRFYMLGYIPAGYTAGNEEECCNDRLFTWIGASCLPDIDETTEKLMESIGTFLYLTGQWDLPFIDNINIYVVPGEFGDIQERGDCEFIDLKQGMVGIDQPNDVEQFLELEEVSILEENTESGEIDNLRETPELLLPNDVEEEVLITIFDINGRVLYSGQELVTPKNFRQFLWGEGIQTATGIYFINIASRTDSKTYKVFLN